MRFCFRITVLGSSCDGVDPFVPYFFCFFVSCLACVAPVLSFTKTFLRETACYQTCSAAFRASLSMPPFVVSAAITLLSPYLLHLRSQPHPSQLLPLLLFLLPPLQMESLRPPGQMAHCKCSCSRCCGWLQNPRMEPYCCAWAWACS